jgi:hypothetical protein
VASKTLRLAAEAGEIKDIHPLPEGPRIFCRTELDGSAARTLQNERGKIQNTPRDHIPINEVYSFQEHRRVGGYETGF